MEGSRNCIDSLNAKRTCGGCAAVVIECTGRGNVTCAVVYMVLETMNNCQGDCDNFNRKPILDNAHTVKETPETPVHRRQKHARKQETNYQRLTGMTTAAEFLQALYRNADGYAEIRMLHKSGDYRKAEKIYRPAQTIHTGNFEVLADMNREYHIYHRVNISSTQDSKKANISQIVALYIDIDDSSEEVLERLHNMPVGAPTAVIFSGGGYHAYYFLRQPLIVRCEDNWREVERTMQGMILAYGDGADDKAKDITRILRTPGFYNIKDSYDPKPLCEVVYMDDDRFGRYGFHELYKLYAPLGTPAKPKIKREIPRAAYSSELPKYVTDYLQNGAPQGERNHKLYVAARFYLDAGKTQFEAEQDLMSRAQMDGLSQSEARNTITSAFRNTPNPSNAIPAHMRNVMAVEDGVA